MCINQERRQFLKTVGVFALATVAGAEALHAQQQKRTLRGLIHENLSKLQTISNKEAGPDYQDPNNTSNPVYVINNPEYSLAPNFKLKEFATTNGKIQPYARIDEDLVIALQQLRDRIQKPIIITSGYRSFARQQELIKQGSTESTKSRHCSGDGADIKVVEFYPKELSNIIIDTLGEDIGLGIYAGHVHLDCRGYKARW